MAIWLTVVVAWDSTGFEGRDQRGMAKEWDQGDE
jgi:hypothetical protein